MERTKGFVDWSAWFRGWWNIPQAASDSPLFLHWIQARNNLRHQHWALAKQRDQSLKRDRSRLEWRDFGADGPNEGFMRTGSVAHLARKASSDVRKGKWLMAIAKTVSLPAGETIRILELGTCLGSGADYLLSGARQGTFYLGLEGSDALAKRTAGRLAVHSNQQKTITVKTGPFEKTLPELAMEEEPFHVIFLDGFHEGKELEKQWEMLCPLRADGVAVVVDDIRWSKDMHEAWLRLTQQKGWMALDLFRMGILTRVPQGHAEPEGVVRCSWYERA